MEIYCTVDWYAMFYVLSKNCLVRTQLLEFLLPISVCLFHLFLVTSFIFACEGVTPLFFPRVESVFCFSWTYFNMSCLFYFGCILWLSAQLQTAVALRHLEECYFIPSSWLRLARPPWMERSRTAFTSNVIVRVCWHQVTKGHARNEWLSPGGLNLTANPQDRLNINSLPVASAHFPLI